MEAAAIISRLKILTPPLVDRAEELIRADLPSKVLEEPLGNLDRLNEKALRLKDCLMKLAAVTIIALSLAIPTAALADPGKNQQAHAKGNAQSAVGHGNDGQAPGHKAIAIGTWTPPGLAKKPHGMPPGQAKKVWNRGEQLPTQYYTQSRYYVTNPSAANLAPAPYGSLWVKVGDTYYLAQTKTGAITQMISALAR